MTHAFRSVHRPALTAIAALGLAACDMDVSNPSVIDASRFDPNTDAATVSLSAQSNFYAALGDMITFTAFFSQEAWSGVVRQETNDIARRVMTAGTSDVSTLWTVLQRAIATNELAVQLLDDGPNAASDVNLARSAMNAGFSILVMAENFCQGAILVGPPLTPDEMLDAAITRFTQAVTVGTAAAAAGAAEGTRIVNAANVGLARAHLQKKEYAAAAAAAALVPASFVHNAVAVDDPSNRPLANGVYDYDVTLDGIVVPDVYRAMNDPRVPWRDSGDEAQDGQPYYQQLKYTGFDAPLRVASGLEASYVAAEAALQTGNPDPALTLIAERRAANGQPAFAGGDAAAVLAELMDQRAREFWLEGKHTGDWQRNPEATPYVGAAGTPFYKAGQGDFGAATCLPVPLSEVNANPNFPKS